jgi:hypothetical protein
MKSLLAMAALALVCNGASAQDKNCLAPNPCNISTEVPQPVPQASEPTFSVVWVGADGLEHQGEKCFTRKLAENIVAFARTGSGATLQYRIIPCAFHYTEDGGQASEPSYTHIEADYKLKDPYESLPSNPKPQANAVPPAKNPGGKEFWLWSGAAAGSSVFSYGGGLACRARNGVEPCLEHYGSFHAMEGVAVGASSILVPLVFHQCRKDFNNSKACLLIPALTIALNTTLGVRQFRIHEPRH